MRNDYHPTRKKSGISRLMQAMGVLFALIILIGVLDKAGVKVMFDQPRGQQTAGLLPGTNALDVPENADNKITIKADPNYDYTDEQAVPSAVNPYAKRTTQSQQIDIREWVDRFASTARAQALEKGVPAGVALAVGIDRLSKGAKIYDWNGFMHEVSIPLIAIKQTAGKQALQQYFKYSANSQKWIQGLDQTHHYSAARLENLMEKYQLEIHDRKVLSIIQNGGRYEQDAYRKSISVGDEVSSELVNRRIENQERSSLSKAAQHDNSAEWEQYYDELVGKEVAKKMARKKLNAGQYLSEEDMESLIEETNRETAEIIENYNISLPGRKINKAHPEAERMLDMTIPENRAAREEYYQRKLKEQNVAEGGN